jgi:hypothetical protein
MIHERLNLPGLVMDDPDNPTHLRNIKHHDVISAMFELA